MGVYVVRAFVHLRELVSSNRKLREGSMPGGFEAAEMGRRLGIGPFGCIRSSIFVRRGSVAPCENEGRLWQSCYTGMPREGERA
jgi:hypothetical protein